MSTAGLRIAVTGASGYLGERVVSHLHRHGVTVIVCPGVRDGFDLTNHEDWNKFSSSNKYDTIIHCAAVVPKTPAEYKDVEAAKKSVLMTETITQYGIQHIVFPSSMVVYSAESKIPVREEYALEDAEGYAGGKLCAERVLKESDVDIVSILRLPGLFGNPRKEGLLYNAALAFARRQDFPLPQPAPMWAAIHVDDAAELLVRIAINCPNDSRTLNAGYAKPMSITRTVSQLAGRFGLTKPEGEAPDFEMDLSRLYKTVGPPEYTLDQRLDELAALAHTEIGLTSN